MNALLARKVYHMKDFSY